MTALQYFRSVKRDRYSWRDSMPQECMVCGHFTWTAGFQFQIHEIERRSAAPRRWGHRCNYLLVCETCHAGQLATMDHAKQLAIKLECDPCHFDLAAWLRIGDPDLKSPDRITMSDVAMLLDRLRRRLE